MFFRYVNNEYAEFWKRDRVSFLRTLWISFYVNAKSSDKATVVLEVRAHTKLA